MFKTKCISYIFSIFLIAFSLLASAFSTAQVTPVRAQGLSLDDWKQIKALLPATVDITQQAYIKASNTGESDWFGASIALSGDTLAVGASLEDSNATGVNGNQADNSAAASGAVYIFIRSGGIWSQQAYIKASNAEASDYFGVSVALSGDTLVVGANQESSDATGINEDQTNNNAPAAGAAYVFTRSGGIWSQQAYLKASNTDTWDHFGSTVAIAGNTIVVGAQYESSNATGVNGNQTDNSAESSGAAYVFTRSGTTWSQQAYLKAANTDTWDFFGNSIAISGDTIAVGAPMEDSNGTGINGNNSNNSASSAGAVYVFHRMDNIWSQQAYIKASNTNAEDQFNIVSISGNTLVVGAPGEDSNAIGVDGDQANNARANSGAVYIFTRQGTSWSQQAYIKASNTDENDGFGGTVDISGNTFIVGVAGEDSNAKGVNGDQTNNSANYAGAAYLFAKTESGWSQKDYIKASNTDQGDNFGSDVAISGNTVAAGALTESSNATGVNGDQTNNLTLYSGAAYVFSIIPPTTVSKTFPSMAKQDGWILESNKKGTGGAINTTAALKAGNLANGKQYRSILSFNTAVLPDNAMITAVTLKLKKQNAVDAPDNKQNQLFMIDLKKGFFGNLTLQASDFQEKADKSFGPFKPAMTDDDWYSFDLTNAKAFINKLGTNGGITQIRFFAKPIVTDGAMTNPILNFYSGDASINRPELTISYIVP